MATSATAQPTLQINLLMRDAERSRAMSLRGRARVEAQFSWKAVARKTAELYKFLLTDTSTEVL